MAGHAWWCADSNRIGLATAGPCDSGPLPRNSSRLANIICRGRLCTDRSVCMTAPTLTTKLDRESPEAKARFAHNKALADELRAKVAEAALGGPDKPRARHVSRGTPPPTERVERLPDPGLPFTQPGPLDDTTIYEGDVNPAAYS